MRQAPARKWACVSRSRRRRPRRSPLPNSQSTAVSVGVLGIGATQVIVSEDRAYVLIFDKKMTLVSLLIYRQPPCRQMPLLAYFRGYEAYFRGYEVWGPLLRGGCGIPAERSGCGRRQPPLEHAPSQSATALAYFEINVLKLKFLNKKVN